MTEKKVQSQIIDHLIESDFSVFKTIACNRKGISDIIACSPKGQFVAIECKAPGKTSRVSMLQQMYIDEVNVRGGYAFVADSLETVKQKLGI